jgi:hypothetical protein
MSVRKGDGTTQTGVSLSWDSVIHMWYVDLTATLPDQAGEWRFKAVSSNPNAFPQWKTLHIADYVDKIDASVSTRATPAQILSDLTPFSGSNIESDVGIIDTKIGSPVTSVSADLAVVDGVVDAIKVKTDKIDDVKAKTDLIPAVPAAQGDVTGAVTSIKGLSDKSITDINTKLGTPVGATISDDIALTKAAADDAKTAADDAELAAAEASGYASTAATQATAAATGVDDIKKVQFGRWKIDGTQLVLYESDDVTELMRFNLFDNTGSPSATRIFERVPV